MAGATGRADGVFGSRVLAAGAVDVGSGGWRLTRCSILGSGDLYGKPFFGVKHPNYVRYEVYK